MTPAAKPATVTELDTKASDAAHEALHVSHNSLASALVHALADLTVIEKGRTVNIETKTGARINYGYADIADVVKRTREPLARHGLTVLTPLGAHGDDLAVSVVFVHEGGETMTFGPFPFPHGRDAQATGSWVTYMRRYALVAALGMAAGDDDDGAAAQPRQPEFVWTQGAVKARLVELFDGDKGKAAEAWKTGGGDNEPPSAELADRLHAEWEANQPKDDAGEGGDT